MTTGQPSDRFDDVLGAGRGKTSADCAAALSAVDRVADELALGELSGAASLYVRIGGDVALASACERLSGLILDELARAAREWQATAAKVCELLGVPAGTPFALSVSAPSPELLKTALPEQLGDDITAADLHALTDRCFVHALEERPTERISHDALACAQRSLGPDSFGHLDGHTRALAGIGAREAKELLSPDDALAVVRAVTHPVWTTKPLRRGVKPSDENRRRATFARTLEDRLVAAANTHLPAVAAAVTSKPRKLQFSRCGPGSYVLDDEKLGYFELQQPYGMDPSDSDRSWYLSVGETGDILGPFDRKAEAVAHLRDELGLG